MPKRKRQSGGAIEPNPLFGPLEQSLWNYVTKPVDLEKQNREVNAYNKGLLESTSAVARNLLEHSEPISGAAGYALGGPTGQVIASAVHKTAQALLKKEPEARQVLNAIAPVARAAARGARNILHPSANQAVRRTKNTRVKSSKKPQAKSKYVKRPTTRRVKEHAEYTLKHSHKRPRTAQFYRDNGLPVPPGAH